MRSDTNPALRLDMTRLDDFGRRFAQTREKMRVSGVGCRLTNGANTVISQYQAQQSKLTVLEEMQAARRERA